MSAGQIRGGLAGRILRVDLSTGAIRSEETAPHAGQWIGGRAINSRILLDEMRRETGWSDPENLLIFGAGALAGIAPGGSRTSVDTKNVFSGGKGSANVGGHFGPESGMRATITWSSPAGRIGPSISGSRTTAWS